MAESPDSPYRKFIEFLKDIRVLWWAVGGLAVAILALVLLPFWVATFLFGCSITLLFIGLLFYLHLSHSSPVEGLGLTHPETSSGANPDPQPSQANDGKSPVEPGSITRPTLDEVIKYDPKTQAIVKLSLKTQLIIALILLILLVLFAFMGYWSHSVRHP